MIYIFNYLYNVIMTTNYFPHLGAKMKDAGVNVNDTSAIISYLLDTVGNDFMGKFEFWMFRFDGSSLTSISKELDLAFVAVANGRRPELVDLKGCHCSEDELCVIFHALDQWAFDSFNPTFPLILE